jgi:hypothetical protein
MKKRLSLASVALMVGLASSSLLSADSADRCAGTSMGAYLGASLLDVAQTTASLRLLNGREDPRLKRLLQWRLVSAIADARKYVDSSPVVDSAAFPSLLPNWLDAIERAQKYVAEHRLEEDPPIDAEGATRRPVENLRVVKAWLSRHLTRHAPNERSP